jgi:hypothetical protein
MALKHVSAIDDHHQVMLNVIQDYRMQFVQTCLLLTYAD